MGIEWNATVFTTLLESSVRIVVVAVAVSGILFIARIHSSAVRRQAWTGVLAAMLAMPLLVAIAPTIGLPYTATIQTIPPDVGKGGNDVKPAPPDHTDRVAPATTVDRRPSIPAANSVPTPQEPAGDSIPTSRERFPWPALLLAVYGMGVSALLARLLWGWRAMRRLIRSSHAASAPDSGAILESDAVATPLTCGVIWPRIVLPHNWREWPEAKLTAVLTHERAHVGRGDALVGFLARVNCAVFWFHPLTWWLERKLAILAEYACDDAVARETGEPERYAAALVEIADDVRRRGERYSWQGIGAYGKGALRNRIDRLLSGVIPQDVPVARRAVGGLLCVLVMGIAAVGRPEARLQQAPEERVALQARGQSCPAPSVIGPTQPLTASDFVQLERTSCFGTCPDYSVRILADGSVSWSGRQFVQVVGTASATVDVGMARALIERYRAGGFYALCERYGVNIDAPSAITTVRMGGQEKRVANAPGWAADLAKEIERLADTHRWIHGDPQTEVLDFRKLDSDSYNGTKPGVTPLMYASGRFGSAEGVRAQLASKADPNAKDSSGWTALMYAALAKDAEVVKALLEGGANPNARSRTGITPLMAQIVIASQISRDPIPALRLLLAAGADINAVDGNGQTALMMVIPRSLNSDRDDTDPGAMARVNLAAVLREAGARSDLRDTSGRTALDLLKEEADSVRVYPKAQYEKLRMILEQPVTSSRPVRVRAVLRPRATEVKSITLQRAGADPVSFTAPVSANGSVEFPSVVPGVYTVLMTPAPAFPASAAPIIVTDSNAGEIEIDAPPMRQVRVNATVQGGGTPPVFWLLLAGRSDSSGPVTLENEAWTRPLPANMTAALTGGARPQLIQLGGTPDLDVTVSVELATGAFGSFGPVVELTRLPDGAYSMMLAEGDYVLTPLLTPTQRSSPGGTDPPPTADNYKMIATSAGVDLGSEPLKVSGANQEIQVTFVRLSPPPPPPAPKASSQGSPDGLMPTGELVIHGPIGNDFIDGPSPVYPPQARAERIQGMVKMEVQIGPDGRVTAVRVLSGHALLNDAAIDAVRKFVFEPQASAVITTVDYTFALVKCSQIVGGCP